MYFMVENTPESVKKQRRAPPPAPEPVEERPCLSLAPFSRPPLVLFENVPIGSSAERFLDVVNPTKKVIQLGLGRAPPPGVLVCLPESQLELSPQQACSVSLRWTPQQPTAQRETIHFTDQFRGRYDVILVLKTIVIKPMKKMRAKKTPPKKIGICSPNPRVTKPTKKLSPKLMTHKKSMSTYQNIKVQQYMTETLTASAKAPVRIYSNKENFSPEHKQKVCPFDSLTSLNSAESFNFNITTSDIFNMRGKENQTYDNFSGVHKFDNSIFTPQMSPKQRRGILSPSTRYNTDNIAKAIDDLTFTPTKTVPTVQVTKTTKDRNQTYEYADNIEDDKIIHDETHSIVMLKSHDENDFNFTIPGPTNRPIEFSFSVESSISSKKIPNTSSPKHYHSPGINFTMNTEFSHITDTSFFPQRCSTEKKLTFNYHNENFMEALAGLDKPSDTYTKPECFKHSLEPDELKHLDQNAFSHPHSNPRLLDFNERAPMKPAVKYGRNCGDGVRSIIEANLWRNDKSPPRSITPPPLSSIPEESTQFSMSHVDRTNPAFSTFTINRTFDKPRDSFCKPRDSISTWQKKSVRCDPTLWKKPAKVKEVPKQENVTLQGMVENLSNMTTNSALHHIADVYTQSSTVDPFLSSTYFYDEEAVDKFEKEFKRWLNYILTPPADLESNHDEIKVDVGKIWTENRNKEIPAAPTKEQVSSQYHNNHRLESVRKSARALMLSPNIVDVYKKLNAQIDKKLISMRLDRNLPMDVGLQKLILELLLCYNPLWLRIGLETLYGTVIPLTSNSDILGLSTFITQRMFNDPYAKSKNSHPSVPNMLLPSYIEYMRKFTLKKFFMLVFFLDQAKQKKLIMHDPCLFRRKALYRESRDLIIQFTKELIAGIGDITRHLRPLGYVVSQKQSYLDEYKYAVHNLAVDLKDGIRLTRVMEIILVKPSLMIQMRTPPVSRLQKIHNVQVALNALKDANFTIVGDITAKDIADGHREKTLSLLWQIIHVFRAPLFEKASVTIQMWWKKKYLGIVIKKRIEHKKEMKKHNAASVIQCWWRKIQYDRLVEKNMKELQAACIIVQKYWRMWSCKRKYLKTKWAVKKIETWYASAKEKKQAEEILKQLLQQHRSVARIQMWYRRLIHARHIISIRNLYIHYCKETKLRISASNKIKKFFKKVIVLKKFREVVNAAVEADRIEKLRNKAATLIQSCVKRWLCRKQYTSLINNVIRCQATVRGFLARKEKVRLVENIVFVQRTFRNKMVTKKTRSQYRKTKQAAIILQRQYRAQVAMKKQKKVFQELKKSVLTIEQKYIALIEMRKCRDTYLRLKNSTITIQKNFRRKQAQERYKKSRSCIIMIQRRYKAKLAMNREKKTFTQTRKSVLKIQMYFRSYREMKKVRQSYTQLKTATIKIQRFIRANQSMKRAKQEYELLRKAAITIQQHYRAQIVMRKTREEYEKMKRASLIMQRQYRAILEMRKQKLEFEKIKSAAIVIQRAFRAKNLMKLERKNFIQLKTSCVTIQQYFRAYVTGKQQRKDYLKIMTAVIMIQNRYREKKLTQETRKEYLKMKAACIFVQRRFRANKEMKIQNGKYIQLKRAVATVQIKYRAKLLRRKFETSYLELKRACIITQKAYRAQLMMRRERDRYIALKKAALTIQTHYKAKILMEKEKKVYERTKRAAIILQQRYRAKRKMIAGRKEYLNLINATIILQRRYRARLAMKKYSEQYKQLKKSVIIIQNRFRANKIMKRCKEEYSRQKTAANKIKTWYRACKVMKSQRKQYLRITHAVNIIQKRYRAMQCLRKTKQEYMALKMAVSIIQIKYRALKAAKLQRKQYLTTLSSVVKIQRWYKSVLQMRRDQKTYLEMKECKRRLEAAKRIQTWYRSIIVMRKERSCYLKLKKSTIRIQSLYRMHIVRKNYLRIRASIMLIQTTFKSYREMKMIQLKFILMKQAAIKIQMAWRARKTRQMFLKLLSAIRSIQITFRRRQWLKNMRKLQQERIEAATCIQKYIRRYLCVRDYQMYRKKVILIQRLWRQKILRRKCVQTTKVILESVVKVQSLARGYLARKKATELRTEKCKLKEERRRHHAASKIQALFRGNRVREQMKHHPAVTEARQRLIRAEPAQREDTMEHQNEFALDVLTHYRDIPSIIRAFVIIEYLTEVYPMIYHKTCNRVAVSLLNYMMMTNRSVSTLDTVRPAAAILVNMARYKPTALAIYSRDKMGSVLKLMMRWSGQDSQYYCALCTFMWLFAKYPHLKEDVTQYLHDPENRNMMHLIRSGVLRKQRMKDNLNRNKTFTPKPVKCVSRTNPMMNASCRSDSSSSDCVLPALEPDYGFKRADRPRYFTNDLHAIDSLFAIYNIPLK